MVTNEKNKNSILKFIFIIIVITLIILTSKLAWSKYASIVNDNASAQVAKWHFDLKNQDRQSITVEGINFPMTRTDGNKSVLEGKLAPGTSGEFKMIVDTSNTQVLTLYNIIINLTDCPTNLKFYTDRDMNKELSKVQIGEKQENGEKVKIHQLSISRFLSLDEVNREHEETLYWRWLMETGDTEEQKYANDLEDSLWIDRDKMTMDIIATGEQVVEVPSQIAIRSISVENLNGSTSSAVTNKASTELADSINANIVLGSDSDSTSTVNVSITNLSDTTYYFYQAKLLSPTGAEIVDDNIDYEVIGLSKSKNTTMGTALIPGSSADVKIVFKHKAGETSSSIFDGIFKLEYRKAYDILYVNFADSNLYPTKVIEGDSIIINMDSSITNLKVSANGALLVQDYGYTYTDNVLEIPNVTKNFTIKDSSGNFYGVTRGLVAVATKNTSNEDNYGDFIAINSKNITDFQHSGFDVQYDDNDGKLEYSTDGSLRLDKNNPIAGVNISDVDLSSEYSIYITIKASIDQANGSVLAISETSNKYLLWICFLNNYFNIHSFYNGSPNFSHEDKSILGFSSFDASKYSNKLLNIQVTANKDGKTKVYLNGKIAREFDSGREAVSYSSIIIGDLRPGRGLKFVGNIYDLAFYSRELTTQEVETNWQHAKTTWDIE